MNIFKRSFLTTIPSLNCIYRNGPLRTIFTQDTLGITAYLQDRKAEHRRPSTKLLHILEDEGNRDRWLHRYPFEMFMDDLRFFVHSVEPAQIDLLKKALEVFLVRSSKQDQANIYKFGSIVMRFFSLFRMPDAATQFYLDEQIGPFFDNLAAYTIFLDMLYDAGQYKELIEVHENSSQSRMKPLKRGSTFITVNAIVFAACFQLDTSFYRQYAFDLYERIKNENLIMFQLHNGLAQVAELKRRNKQPEECLNILSQIKGRAVSGIYVKLLALLDLKHFDEAHEILVAMLRMDDAKFGKVFPIPNELLALFKSRLIKAGKQSVDFEITSEQLMNRGRTTPRTLNDAICHQYPKRMVIFRPYRYTKVHDEWRNKII